MKKVLLFLVLLFTNFFYVYGNDISEDFDYVKYQFGDVLKNNSFSYNDDLGLISDKVSDIKNISVNIPSYNDEINKSNDIIDYFFKFDFYGFSQSINKGDECIRKFKYGIKSKYGVIKNAREKIILVFGYDNINNEIDRLGELSTKIYEDNLYLEENFDDNIVFTEEKAEEYNSLYLKLKINYKDYKISKHKLEVILKVLNKFHNNIYNQTCVETKKEEVKEVEKEQVKSSEDIEENSEVIKEKTKEELLKEKLEIKAEKVFQKLENRLSKLNIDKKIKIYERFIIKLNEYKNKSSNKKLVILIELLVEKIENYISNNTDLEQDIFKILAD